MANFLEIVGNTSPITGVTGVNTDLVASFDVSSFSSFILTLAGTFSLTLQAQWANEPTFASPQASIVSSGTSLNIGASIMTAAGIYVFPRYGRYLRIRASAFTSNTSLSGILECLETPLPGIASLVSQTGANFVVQQGNGSAGGLATQWGVILAQKNATVAVGAGNTVIKNAVGYAATITVTTAGTTGFTAFDNATTNSGTQLYNSKTAPALGDIYTVDGPAVNGITIANTATGPALTVYYT